MELDLNWLAVVLASLAAFVLGWLWYSPLLFGNIWMKEVWKVKDQKEMKVSAVAMFRSMGIALALQVLAAVTLAYFLDLQWQTLSDEAGLYAVAVETSLWIWAAFMLPLNLSGYLWEGRKLKLAVISAGQSLASLLAIGLILTAMG